MRYRHLRGLLRVEGAHEVVRLTLVTGREGRECHDVRRPLVLDAALAGGRPVLVVVAEVQALEVVDERVVDLLQVAPHAADQRQLVGDVQGGVAVGRIVDVAGDCHVLHGVQHRALPEPAVQIVLGEPKSGHVANAPRIRRREPKFLGHRVSVEEAILIRAAVNARGGGERVVEQEVRGVAVLVLVVEHPPVIVRADGLEDVTFQERVVREMVFRVGRCTVVTGVTATGTVVHPDVVVGRADGIPGQHLRLGQLRGALVVQAGRQRSDRIDTAGRLVAVESRSDAEQQIVCRRPLQLAGRGQAGAAADLLAVVEVGDVAFVVAIIDGQAKAHGVAQRT